MEGQESVGDRLRTLMQNKGWSENELSRRSGVPQPTIHRILAGESKSPRQSNLDKLADALGASRIHLTLGGQPAPDSEESNACIDIFEIRRTNLQRLVDSRFRGNKSALAQAAGRQASYISRCLITAPSNQHRKNIGEGLARELEKELTLQPGALDERPADQVGGMSGNAQEEQSKSEGFMTQRSKSALNQIEKAVLAGRLTESDVLLLEQIANRIAARPAPADDTHNNPHERLKNKLGNHDSSTDP